MDPAAEAAKLIAARRQAAEAQHMEEETPEPPEPRQERAEAPESRPEESEEETGGQDEQFEAQPAPPTEDPEFMQYWATLEGPAKERLRRGWIQRNEAFAKLKELEDQNKVLMTMLQAQQGNQATNQMQAQSLANAPEPPAATAYPEPFPKEGTIEEQDEWRVGKKAWDASQKAALRVAQEENRKLIYALAPHLQELEIAKSEREWQKLNPVLDGLDLSREEIEPVVRQILQNDSKRSLRSAVFEAADIVGALAPKSKPRATPRQQAAPPSVQTPGAGRMPTQEQTPEQRAEQHLQETAERLRKAGQQGDFQTASDMLAGVWSKVSPRIRR